MLLSKPRIVSPQQRLQSVVLTNLYATNYTSMLLTQISRVSPQQRLQSTGADRTAYGTNFQT